ncbi:MAG: hypothetical protein QOD72_361 [Acidimicrobiaceae bacterium]|nr:hypothetical protein [Acidimicrobiaceae bacterium]
MATWAPERPNVEPVSPEIDLVPTRRALHAVAEQVLAAACYAAEGRIGLLVVPDGFGTPEFGDGRRVEVQQDELVVVNGDDVQRERLTTLRRAGELAGVEPNAPLVYPPATVYDPDRPLDIARGAARVIADWFAVVDAALRTVAAELTEPTAITLWPEHFDLALAAAEVNYGGSPGDDEHTEPYLYVGPFARPLPAGRPGFWNEPFGASLTRSAVADVEAAVDFFRRGRDASH